MTPLKAEVNIEKNGVRDLHDQASLPSSSRIRGKELYNPPGLSSTCESKPVIIEGTVHDMPL